MRKAFENKTVVITGIGRGLGAALAIAFGKEGAFVAGFDLREEDVLAVTEKLQQTDIPCFLTKGDVADESNVEAFFTRLRNKNRRVDVLINNAGITNIKLFRDNSNEDIRRLMEINFMGSVYSTRCAYKDIVENKGSFIAISSVAGFAPLIGRTAYAASKHALLGFYETLRTELAGEDCHVMVVCPGYIDTNLRDHVYKQGESNKTTKHKVGKNASPTEVANLILKATIKRKPMLVTGIGRISHLLKRLAPMQYEKLMIRKLKAGFEKM